MQNFCRKYFYLKYGDKQEMKQYHRLLFRNDDNREMGIYFRYTLREVQSPGWSENQGSIESKELETDHSPLI